MRAVLMREFGGPEVLELAELARPEPGPDQVLIRVTRAGVNFADTHIRTNTYLARAELPLTPGSEVAGVRDDTSERVVAWCGSGGYAEYALADAARTYAIPDAIADEQALALLVAGTTAWHLYRTAARLAAGESVVVHSGAGGVGSLAVQLARSFGAGRVIASASSQAKRELTCELGADAAIDSVAGGMTEAILAANGGRPVDVVLDAAGGAVFEASRAALAPFGRIVVHGISTSEQNAVRTGSLLRRSHGVIGFWLAHCLERPEMVETALSDLFARCARGELRALVGGVYPLEQAAQAQIDLLGRGTTGKLLLDPTRPCGASSAASGAACGGSSGGRGVR
jgi:NADPH2:quinone reductase